MIEKSINYKRDEKPNVSYKFSYDSNNNLVKKVTNFHDGGREDDAVQIFLYDGENNLTKSWYSRDGKLIAIDKYETSNDGLVKITSTSAYGNWEKVRYEEK